MGSATTKQERQLGETKDPSGGGKRIAPGRFKVAPQAILSVTDHSERVQQGSLSTFKPASKKPLPMPEDRAARLASASTTPLKRAVQNQTSRRIGDEGTWKSQRACNLNLLLTLGDYHSLKLVVVERKA